jgi:hypothetical protein
MVVLPQGYHNIHRRHRRHGVRAQTILSVWGPTWGIDHTVLGDESRSRWTPEGSSVLIVPEIITQSLCRRHVLGSARVIELGSARGFVIQVAGVKCSDAS